MRVGVFVDGTGSDVGPDSIVYFREVVFRFDVEESSSGHESLTVVAEALEDCLLFERGGDVEKEQHIARGVGGDFLGGGTVDVGHRKTRAVAEDGDVERVVAGE